MINSGKVSNSHFNYRFTNRIYIWFCLLNSSTSVDVKQDLDGFVLAAYYVNQAGENSSTYALYTANHFVVNLLSEKMTIKDINQYVLGWFLMLRLQLDGTQADAIDSKGERIQIETMRNINWAIAILWEKSSRNVALLI